MKIAEVLNTLRIEFNGKVDVRTAITGRQVVEKILGEQIVPALVYLNFDLDSMNGLEVLGWFKIYSETKAVPVIMIVDPVYIPDIKKQVEKLGGFLFKAPADQKVIDKMKEIIKI